MQRTKRKSTYSPMRQMQQVRGRGDEWRPDGFRGQQNSSCSSSNGSNQMARSAARQQTELPSEQNMEEVYICSCCGIDDELSPGIRYMSTFKSLFLLFNFLVFAFGLANLGMGLWFRIDPKVYEIHKYIQTQNFTIAGWIMLFGGFSACIMSLIGVCSAFKQIASLLVFYSIFTILHTICFIGALVLLTVYGLGNSLERFMIKEIMEQIRRRAISTEELDLFATNNAAQFVDFVQVKLRCCGAYDFKDYQRMGMTIPTTCFAIEKNFVNAPGCGRALRLLFDLRAGMATGFVSGSILVQLVAIILSTVMFCAIYHWRANPRPRTASPPVDQAPAEYPLDLYGQRPRSRTPIVV